MAFAKIEIFDTGDTIDFHLDLDGINFFDDEVNLDEVSPAQAAALHMWNLYHEAMDDEDEYDANE